MPRDPRSRKGFTCHKGTSGERGPGTSHLYPQPSRPQASPQLNQPDHCSGPRDLAKVLSLYTENPIPVSLGCA